MTAPSIRARVRAELTEEIKSVARRHLATEGANLSLRAVARDLGLASSALYRYFASRDELLTALILDAYRALGDAAEDADAAVTDTDLRGRWLAVCHAVRQWALRHPAEYTLLYGSPVPGYAAPADTTALAQRVALTLTGILTDAARAGRLTPPPASAPPPPVRADLARLIASRIEPRDEPAGALTEEQLARGLAGWSQLFGLVSFEIFGRLEQVVERCEPYFDHQIRLTADFAGLP
ncbi:TetR/AcrR family transcriptional regulator [Micromonospora sp. NBC_01699]|uniref:TetR/AcrR family transcriptional regulator n=1 Tax=Micromonospora sp. NBC_01699 TaxID=2975984 RepID=UPI002E2AC717|nr:TetR/AcrR family transcriptional regulator [Micromonospora sp. NBC_01699]